MSRRSRSVLLVVHTGRREAVAAARDLAARLVKADADVRALVGEADRLQCDGVTPVQPGDAAGGALDLVVAFGGDGTLLRAAEVARPAGIPLLGVNLGHIGFLAEVDRSDLEATAERILTNSYDVEERMTLDVAVLREGAEAATGWALNDVTVEKAARQRMLDLVVEVDGRPLSRWGGDGIVCATPTGSTAYAFSAGGPVVWPTVQALLLVPLSAHALFARPLVVSPDSCVAIELLTDPGAVLFCDGRRTVELQARDRIEVRRGAEPVKLVRLRTAPFTDRLVEKFRLPVRGWRGPIDD
ncbi:MAG TPA: NAD kinase [Mycobacteriales bacterium]|nr:NAD kinase [Mycobacteriales bacterium]